MSQSDAITLSVVVVLIVVLLLALRVWRRDPLLRRIRFGVFLERERFLRRDDDEYDYDWESPPRRDDLKD